MIKIRKLQGRPTEGRVGVIEEHVILLRCTATHTIIFLLWTLHLLSVNVSYSYSSTILKRRRDFCVYISN